METANPSTASPSQSISSTNPNTGQHSNTPNKDETDVDTLSKSSESDCKLVTELDKNIPTEKSSKDEVVSGTFNTQNADETEGVSLAIDRGMHSFSEGRENRDESSKPSSVNIETTSGETGDGGMASRPVATFGNTGEIASGQAANAAPTLSPTLSSGCKVVPQVGQDTGVPPVEHPPLVTGNPGARHEKMPIETVAASSGPSTADPSGQDQTAKLGSPSTAVTEPQKSAEINVSPQGEPPTGQEVLLSKDAKPTGEVAGAAKSSTDIAQKMAVPQGQTESKGAVDRLQISSGPSTLHEQQSEWVPSKNQPIAVQGVANQQKETDSSTAERVQASRIVSEPNKNAETNLLSLIGEKPRGISEEQRSSEATGDSIVKTKEVSATEEIRTPVVKNADSTKPSDARATAEDATQGKGEILVSRLQTTDGQAEQLGDSEAKAETGESRNTASESLSETETTKSVAVVKDTTTDEGREDSNMEVDVPVKDDVPQPEESSLQSKQDADTSVVESMETDGPTRPPVFFLEDNSKDAPPQDFIPFSHYTEDGKLIDKEEKETGSPLQRPALIEESVNGNSELPEAMPRPPPAFVDESSFPEDSGVSDSVASSLAGTTPAAPSEFQGQFMDFLKSSDNATQHSLPTPDEPAEGAAAEEGKTAGVAEQSEEGATEKAAIGEKATPTRRGRGGRRRGRGARRVDTSSQGVPGEEGSVTGSGTPRGRGSRGSRQVRQKKVKEVEKPASTETTKAEVKSEDTETNGTKEEGKKADVFPAERLFEYQWPQSEKNAEWFFLQEHLSAYLGVVSFKRKYPDLERRPVGMHERNFLQEKGVVSEMQCDLGLTALKSDQVYELMQKDFSDKYQAYAEILHAREQERIKEKSKASSDMAKMDKNHITDLVKKAIRSAAEFNAQFMRERREERRAYFDLQTNEIHYPIGSLKKLPPEATKPSVYPVALIPGQFQDYYKKYTPQQMKYFPLSTVTYDPPRHLETIYADPADKYESELDSQSASSQGEAEEGSSSSGSSSGSGSDEDSDSSSEEEEPEVQAPVPPVVRKPSRTPRGKKVNSKDQSVVCNICQGTSEKNKIGEAEELVKCSECGRHGHPSCLELTQEMIPNIKTYPWQCMECKTCVECMDPYDEDKMMFCDHCDRGYHTFCVGLRSIPTGRWECPSCRPEPPTKKRRRYNLTATNST